MRVDKPLSFAPSPAKHNALVYFTGKLSPGFGEPFGYKGEPARGSCREMPARGPEQPLRTGGKPPKHNALVYFIGKLSAGFCGPFGYKGEPARGSCREMPRGPEQPLRPCSFDQAVIIGLQPRQLESCECVRVTQSHWHSDQS